MSSSQMVWGGETCDGIPIIGSSKTSVELVQAMAVGDTERVQRIQNGILMQALGMMFPMGMETSPFTSGQASQSADTTVQIPESSVQQFVSDATINKKVHSEVVAGGGV